jgi:hypothetical protein
VPEQAVAERPAQTVAEQQPAFRRPKVHYDGAPCCRRGCLEKRAYPRNECKACNCASSKRSRQRSHAIANA